MQTYKCLNFRSLTNCAASCIHKEAGKGASMLTPGSGSSCTLRCRSSFSWEPCESKDSCVVWITVRNGFQRISMLQRSFPTLKMLCFQTVNLNSISVSHDVLLFLFEMKLIKFLYTGTSFSKYNGAIATRYKQR